MGRRPCCAKVGLERGAWTAQEDGILSSYIKIHGEGRWRDLPQRAGLKRCGKSCRLRWMNYLRPDIKRGNITVEEEDLIIKLHKLLGNRWSLIAGRLPGRTDNEIKNYWNTNLRKKMLVQQGQKNQNYNNINLNRKETMGNSSMPLTPIFQPHPVIRTKAVRCTKVIIPQYLDNQMFNKNYVPTWSERDNPSSSSNSWLDFDISDLLVSDVLNSEFHQEKEINEDDNTSDMILNMSSGSDFPLPAAYEAMLDNLTTDEALLENWNFNDPLQPGDQAFEPLATFFSNSEVE